jgi:type I restriction enzyme S subunit
MAQQKMVNLPKGWITNEFESVCNVVSGNAFKSKDFVETGVPVVKISNVQSGYYLIKNQEYLPQSFVEDKNSSFFVNPEDLLMALTRPITNGKLKVCHYPKGSVTGLLNQRVCKLKFDIELDNKYCEYYLLTNSFMKLVEENLSETLQPNLSPRTLLTLPFVIAPLAEQKRIVEKLDSLLAQVDTIQQRLNNLPNIIKRFRQSVLAAAVSGKLTEQWRGENQAEEWNWLTLGDVSTVATGSTPKRTEPTFWDSSDVPWLTSSVTGNEFCDTATQFVSNKAVKECRLKVFPSGSLLLAMYGEGKTRGQVTEITIDATCNQACAAILVDEAKIAKAFVKLRLLENYEATRMAAEGGNQPNLNLSKVRDITIPVPSSEEQTEIVRLVEQYFALADTLEKHMKNAKQRVDNLTQAILAKAFKGELVPQDENDEPADKLLERIKAAREQAEALEKAAKKAVKASKANKAKTKPKTKGVA